MARGTSRDAVRVRQPRALAAAGLGLLAAPETETAPLGPLGAAAGASELALTKIMGKRMGMVGDAFHIGRAKIYMRAAEALTAAGSLLAATSRGSRLRSALGCAGLLAGSALTRFGIFQARMTSAEDPKHTVVAQRQRIDEKVTALQV